MNFAETAAFAAERLPLPDALLRAGIATLVGRTDHHLNGVEAAKVRVFAREMEQFPIALHSDAANAQHYEVPAKFFELVLGARRKYSSCHYGEGVETLDEAEENALAQTIRHAGLEDGQRILELGCGWGSLSLTMAEKFPAARITAVSNSHSQREFIQTTAATRGLENLSVITCDMNEFQAVGQYDRIVSVEMFEHMANWRALLSKLYSWVNPDGRVFIHIFTHDKAPYRFDHEEKGDWIAQHFFTGGIMPSHGLMHCFDDMFIAEDEWRWSGQHYARTARDWLRNFDRNLPAIMPILRETYGTEAEIWRRRWRLFFLATEGLFGHANGNSWGVSHYRLRPV
jgi:cyclopropane-fatty-acyl-phospholipid synthase